MNRSRKFSIAQSYGASSARATLGGQPADYLQPTAEALYPLAAMNMSDNFGAGFVRNRLLPGVGRHFYSSAT